MAPVSAAALLEELVRVRQEGRPRSSTPRDGSWSGCGRWLRWLSPGGLWLGASPLLGSPATIF